MTIMITLFTVILYFGLQNMFQIWSNVTSLGARVCAGLCVQSARTCSLAAFFSVWPSSDSTAACRGGKGTQSPERRYEASQSVCVQGRGLDPPGPITNWYEPGPSGSRQLPDREQKQRRGRRESREPEEICTERKPQYRQRKGWR